MPKILLGISSSYCASFLRGQVSFLSKNGYEVVIISGPGKEIRRLAETEGGRLYEISFTKRITPVKDLLHLWQIIKVLRKEKPDIVNTGNPKSGFLIMMACWLVQNRHRIFTMHGLLSDTQTKFRQRLIAFTEKLSCRIARKVIVVSDSLLQHARERNILAPEKGIVIENGSCNGLDTTYFSNTPALLPEAARLSAQLGLKDEKETFTIGFAGRISKDKGMDILLGAFNMLKQKYRFLQLLVAGPVEYDTRGIANIESLLVNSPDVFCTGMMEDIRPAYHLMDVLVLPSFREGLPNVLIEASSMEIPVIASDIPGCRDALLPGITGELVEKGSINSLATALEKMISNPALRRQYGMNGRKFVEDRFPDYRIWEGQLLFYREMLSPKQTLPL
ncbi:MAG: glycosyltransferase family 4 protein [Chitinophagaceae bacterium]|nr:glycosyltransferase family 4 protein [Chitinophagaceae bacterium]MCW5927592.1 glycosyltransferase family 4 protein [Chitinophagaceae bacterium]